MKTKILSLLAFAMLNVFAFVACSSDDKKNEDSQGNNTFFCKIDGVDYQPPSVNGQSIAISNTILITGATGSNAQQVQLFLPLNVEPGTYTQLNDFSAPVFVQAIYTPPTSQDASDDGFASTGQIVVTEHNTGDKRIKGTFNFVTEPSINGETVWNISEGVFDIRYE